MWKAGKNMIRAAFRFWLGLIMIYGQDVCAIRSETLETPLFGVFIQMFSTHTPHTRMCVFGCCYWHL